MTDEQREPTIEAVPRQKTDAELKVERHTRKVIEYLLKMPLDDRRECAVRMIEAINEMESPGGTNETRAPST
jgi:hypothetical protein